MVQQSHTKKEKPCVCFSTFIFIFSPQTVMAQVKIIFVIGSLFLSAVGAGTHSLWYYFTLTTGRTPFPFVLVGKIDDITFETSTSKDDFHRYWIVSSDTQEHFNFRKYHGIDAQDKMRAHIQRMMQHFNHTGTHTLQRLAGCELDEDGTGRVGVYEAYDGEQFLHSTEGSGFWSLPPGHSNTEKFTSDLMSAIAVRLYLRECLNILKMYVTEGRNILNRRQKPKIRMLHKNSDTEKKVTCLATGFYPRHINMTLLRDGQPVPPEQLEQGDVLPNGDGTYQQRKSVVISLKEEGKKLNYSCSVYHVSLDNKLDISWVQEMKPNIRLIIKGTILGTGFLILIIILGIMKWKKSDLTSSEESIAKKTLLTSDGRDTTTGGNGNAKN